MTTEQFANNATTTLNGTINASQTTLVVSNATSFPPVPQFRIIVESEIMLVTGVSGTTYTVTRGAENTTNTTHNNGVTVSMILTSGAMAQFKTDTTSDSVTQSITQSRTTNMLVDAFINRPAAGSKGRFFFSTDGGIAFVDDGTAWRPIAQNVLCTEPPSAATFSIQVNYSTTTLTKSNGALRINAPTAGATQLRAALTNIPIPSACEIQILPNLLNSQVPTSATGVPCVGVCMRESSSGKIASIKYGFNTPFGTNASIVSLGNWSAATTRTANFDYENSVTPIFLRMRIVSGNVLREVSQDLNTWDTVRTDTVASLFTTQPDQYGICVQVENTMIAYIPHIFMT